MSRCLFKLDKEKSLNEDQSLNILTLSEIGVKEKKSPTERGEIVYIVVEIEQQLKRSYIAKEEAAKPWFFTHV